MKKIALLLAMLMMAFVTACDGIVENVLSEYNGKTKGESEERFESIADDKTNYVDCTMCGGTGKYCVSCTDGKCDYCEGTGGKECGICHGTGNCNLCKGTGKRPNGNSTRDCPICQNGECTSCNDGIKTCNKCNGTQNCRTCYGERECVQCNGKGKYKIVKNPSPNPSPLPSPPNPYPGDDYVCPLCNNSGYASCTMCFGSGECTYCVGTGYYETYIGGKYKKMDCSSCSGGTCSYCGGDGEERCMCKSYGN